MKCITYKKAKTKEKADRLIHERCQRILECDDESVVIDLFKKLCGNIFYRSLFVIPEHELIHQQRYTIASVVFVLDGYLQKDARAMLERITDVTISSKISTVTLIEMLHECTFREILEPFGIPHTEFYLACFRVYLMLENMNNSDRDKLLRYIRVNGRTHHEAWLVFEEEVYKKNGHYFH